MGSTESRWYGRLPGFGSTKTGRRGSVQVTSPPEASGASVGAWFHWDFSEVCTIPLEFAYKKTRVIYPLASLLIEDFPQGYNSHPSGSAGMWMKERRIAWAQHMLEVGYGSYQASVSSHETLHATCATEIRSGTKGGDRGPRGMDNSVLICKTGVMRAPSNLTTCSWENKVKSHMRNTLQTLKAYRSVRYMWLFCPYI